MKKIFICQSNYVPWLGFFIILNTVQKFLIYDKVKYSKGSWRNRNKILIEGKPIWLTIPLNQSTISTEISNVKTANNLWISDHIEKINYGYRKFPKHRRKIIIDLLQGTLNMNKLTEINTFLYVNLMEMLDIKSELILDETLKVSVNPTANLVSVILKNNSMHYVSGPSAKNYLDVDLFSQNNIKLSYINYNLINNHPLMNNLSIIHYICVYELSEIKNLINNFDERIYEI